MKTIEQKTWMAQSSIARDENGDASWKGFRWPVYYSRLKKGANFMTPELAFLEFFFVWFRPDYKISSLLLN